MKYFLYCRVSSDSEDKQVLGLPSQKKELEAYAKKHELNVVKCFQERKSAYKTGREQFNDMLSRIEAGEADGVLTYHLTRIARNSFDGGRVIYMMDEKSIKEIRTPEKVYNNCSDDKFIMQIHFAMSKKSSDDTSQFVKRDIQSKLDKREYPGQAPLGYLNMAINGTIAGKAFDQEKQNKLSAISETRPLNRIEQDPIAAPLVKELFDRASVGNLTLRQLGEEAFKIGLVGKRSNKQLTKHSVNALLRNSFYYGCFTFDNRFVEGIHKPIIGKQQFDQVQSVLNGASRPVNIKREYAYTQMITCGHCNARMLSGDFQKGTHYYRCTLAKEGGCTNTAHYRQDAVETQIMAYFEGIELDQEVIDFMLVKLSKENEAENDLEQKSRKQLQKQYDQIQTTINRLAERWMSVDNSSGDLISNDEYKAYKAKYNQELSEVQSLLKDNTTDHKTWLERAEDLFEFSRELRQTYSRASVNDKRAILGFIGTDYILKDGEVTLTVAEPFSYLIQAKQKFNYIRTTKKPYSIRDKAALAIENAEWRDRRDSNSQPPP